MKAGGNTPWCFSWYACRRRLAKITMESYGKKFHYNTKVHAFTCKMQNGYIHRMILTSLFATKCQSNWRGLVPVDLSCKFEHISVDSHDGSASLLASLTYNFVIYIRMGMGVGDELQQFCTIPNLASVLYNFREKTHNDLFQTWHARKQKIRKAGMKT